MKISHNPGTILNGFVSMSRNVFLISSMALAFLGYSRKSEIFNKVSIKIVPLIIILFSIIYGLKASYDFNLYLNYMQNDNITLKPPYSFQIKQWKDWVYLLVVYTILLTFAFCFGIRQIFKKK